MLRVGDPLAVRRPRRVHRARWNHPRIVSDDFRLSRRDVHDPELEVRVVEHDPLSVGRPRRRIEVALRGNLDLARRRQSILRLDVQRIFTRAIAEVRQRFSVGRPRRLMLGRRARVREVADIALVGGDRVDLAPRFDGNALARRRQCEIAHTRADVLPLRHHPGEVARGGDVHNVRLAGFRIEQVHVAGLLEYHGTAIRGGVQRFDVVVGERRELRQLLGLCVVAPDVRDTVPIREKGDGLVARPYGVAVLRLGRRSRRGRRREMRRTARRSGLCDDQIRRSIRRRLEVEGLEVDDPDRTILAAAIVAALLVPRVVHAVREVPAVRRHLADKRARQRHRYFDAAVHRHCPKPRSRRRRI